LGFISSIRLSSTARLELTSLYVLPRHFGTGIGAVLYDEFDRELSPGQVGTLEVWAGTIAPSTSTFAEAGLPPP
jgi:hypothetical protein